MDDDEQKNSSEKKVRIDGLDKLEFKNGGVHEVEVIDGIKHGKGVYKFANGDVYEGEFKENEMNGQGKLKYTNGDEEEGTFKDGKIHYGLLKHPKSVEIEEGEGEFIRPNGNREKVHWKENNLGVTEISQSKEPNMPKDLGKPAQKKVQNQITINFPVESDYKNYIGESEKGKMNGHGRLEFKNGDSYEGEFVDNKKHGKGVYKFVNGDVLENEYVEDRKHGKELFRFTDGHILESTYVNDKKHGTELFKFVNGDVIKSEYVDNKKQDKELLILANGNTHVYKNELEENKTIRKEAKNQITINFPDESDYKNYTGESEKGKMSGHGRLEFKNGAVYTGFFKENQMHGEGIYECNYGKNVYKCDFVEGKMNGKGTYENAFGDFFDGNFLDGKMHHGMLKLKNGNIYEGDFAESRMNGHGKLEFKNGDIYEGEFADNKIQGKGLCKLKNGASYNGNFENGKMDGNGIYKFANGNEYNGEFRENEINGQGKLKFKNGDEQEGIFKEGKLVSGIFKHVKIEGMEKGDGEFIDFDGKREKISWEYNKTQIIPTDSMESAGNMKDQISINFLGDGSYKNYTGKLEGGIMNGYGKLEFKNGASYNGNFENGKMDGNCIYKFANGNEYNGEFRENEINGQGKLKFKNGDEREGIFKNGMIVDNPAKHTEVQETKQASKLLNEKNSLSAFKSKPLAYAVKTAAPPSTAEKKIIGPHTEKLLKSTTNNKAQKERY